MREIAAIAESAADVQHLAREIARAHVALQDHERALESSERKLEGLREEGARRRVDIGRLLIEAKRGIKHGGWLPYLEALGIGEDSARRWMSLAGFVEQQSKSSTPESVRDLNPATTLAAAGIDKRPRKRDEEPDSDYASSVPSSIPSTPSLDISRDLAKLTDKICSFAESLTDRRYRALVANQLRETARLIEEMP